MEFYREDGTNRVRGIVCWITDIIVVVAMACYTVYAFGNLVGCGSLFILPLVSVRKSYSYHPVIQLFVVAQLSRSIFIGNSGAQ